MDSYNKLLQEAYASLPSKAKEKDRFKPPVFDAFVHGTQTIVGNFMDVVEALRRKPEHLIKFLTKETGAPAQLDKRRLILKGKVRSQLLNNKLKVYINEYVLCNECSRPDTDLVSQEGVQYLRCQACGARTPVRVIK